jgi:hypothetical protein
MYFAILTAILPPFGLPAAKKARKEGYFSNHSAARGFPQREQKRSSIN